MVMTDEELHHLNRKALLETMIEQAKEMDRLREQADELREQRNKLEHELEETHRALKNRNIMLDEAGSIAEAALRLNGIFEVAQAASQQYIENIRQLSERQSSICAKREAESREKAENLLADTEKKCREREAACRKRCEDMEANAKQKSEAYWSEVSLRLETFYKDHQELKKLLEYGREK